jgi:hypothetical protein
MRCDPLAQAVRGRPMALLAAVSILFVALGLGIWVFLSAAQRQEDEWERRSQLAGEVAADILQAGLGAAMAPALGVSALAATLAVAWPLAQQDFGALAAGLASQQVGKRGAGVSKALVVPRDSRAGTTAGGWVHGTRAGSLPSPFAHPPTLPPFHPGGGACRRVGPAWRRT